MKKIIIPFALLIMGYSVPGFAQQKPSQRAVASEINKVKEKQVLRNKIAAQNKQQIIETNGIAVAAEIQQSSQQNEKQQENQKPIKKSSDQPIIISDRSRKKG